MIKSLNHIGIAVTDLERSVAKFKTIFNITDIHYETVESQKVNIASFQIGEITIELTAPTGPDSPIAKFIEKRGEGIHHLAFEASEIENELNRLGNSDIQLINEKPTEGAHNMKIAFLHPKSTNGVLIELCERKIK
jgi:methylmalonyl-CoA/ethylmalonyl-CoA epimerase